MLSKLYKVLSFISGLLLLFFVFPVKIHAQSSELISVGAIVTASSSIDSLHLPANIVDGKQATTWFTGDASPGWVLIDLKNTYTINRISLDLYLDDNYKGRTVHSILAGVDPNNLVKVIDLDQITQMSQHIEIPLLKPIPGIRYLKIIIQSPSKYFGFREVNIYKGSESVQNHLVNFGYYYGYPSETVSRLLKSNLTTMHYDNNVRANLTDNYNNKLRTILVLDGLLFDHSQRHYTLMNDWLTRWNTFTQTISGLEHTIYALYFDEPTSTHTISQSEFLLVTNKIRQTYPSMPIMIAEGGSDFPDPLLTATYLTNVTDIAFDYYFIRHGWPDNYTGWGQYLAAYEKLEAVAGNRKIWLIPENIARFSSELSRIPDVFERYLSLGMTKNKVVGLLVYKWPLDTIENINYAVSSLVKPDSPNYNAVYTARLNSVATAIIDSASCDNNILLPGKHDDSSTCIHYFDGNWVVFWGMGPYRNDMHYSTTIGDKAKFEFQGTSFSLIFTKFNNREKLKVTVDQTQSYEINQYSQAVAWQSQWDLPTTLPSGIHTVELEHMSGQYVDIDGLIIRNDTSTASPYPTKTPTLKQGDANGDNKVDGIDYTIWLNHYNEAVSGILSGDFDNSGRVDGVDYTIWLNHYEF